MPYHRLYIIIKKFSQSGYRHAKTLDDFNNRIASKEEKFPVILEAKIALPSGRGGLGVLKQV